MALAGPWKSLSIFSRFSRPGKSLKTDMALESPWICVWRSLKVLEFDFLKCRDRTSWHWKRCSRSLLSDLKCARNPFSAGALPRTPLGELMTLIHCVSKKPDTCDFFKYLRQIFTNINNLWYREWSINPQSSDVKLPCKISWNRVPA